MKRDRRQFIGMAASTAALGQVEGFLGSKAFALAQDRFDPRRLRSRNDVWADVRYLERLGPRPCGSPAHARLTRFLEQEFVKIGMTLDNIEHDALVQWLPRTVSLRGPTGPLSISAFCRWSAVTGPEGVTAPVRYLGRASGPSRFALALAPETRARIDVPADVRGCIALIEVTTSQRPLGQMFAGQVADMADREGGQPMPPLQGPSASNVASLPDDLEPRLKAAGALGVIYVWADLADAEADGVWRFGSDAMPSVWVTASTGRQLRVLADQGAPVTLTVDAELRPNTPTRTIVATLPGATDEAIILWTHLDGPNALQENGSIAILNLVRYFARLPRSERQRSLVVVAPEGHFAEQYLPTSAWIKERPDLMRKAVAFVAVEHLGGNEWLGNPSTNAYAATGKTEIAFAFCPTLQMQSLAKGAVAEQHMGRQAIIATDRYAFTPAMAAWRQTKLATFAYVSIPNYLMSEAPDGHISKLNPELYYAQLQTLARLVHGVDATPTAVLIAD